VGDKERAGAKGREGKREKEKGGREGREHTAAGGKIL
jgi:hypothetical protein